MSELLTTKQIQQLLQVDRTTIYRMLKDGRLTGIKVGSHWRFRREEIDNLLSLAHGSDDADENPIDVLPLHCVQSIQNVFGQIAEVGAVVTDMEGKSVTEVSHCSEFCTLVQNSPSGYQACLKSWGRLAKDTDSRPVFNQCHAKLQYARGFIEVEDHPRAMIIAGQFFLNNPAPESRKSFVMELAATHKIDSAALLEADSKIQILDQRKQDQIANWISEVAKTFGDISSERSEMLKRLRAISEISNINQN